MTDVAMSEKCICGWNWKNGARPVTDLCGECREERDEDRDLTLASFREEVIVAAKEWLDDSSTTAICLLTSKIEALKKAEAEYVWVPSWKKESRLKW